MRRHLADSVRELSRSFAHLFDSYRPELHYMRGPGPKCQAKGAETKAQFTQAVREPMPPFVENTAARA
jgi:hypothetical protein